LLVLCGGYFSLLVPYGLHLGEEGDVVYLIYRAFEGQRPYVDFATGYTPGFFRVNAALFRAFGVNLLVIRWSLVLVHLAAVLGLYCLSRTLVPVPLALVAPAAYVGLMPVYQGEMATFNIPYPAWYLVATWCASLLACLRFLRARKVWWLLVASLLAGVGTAFKPNTGAFNLAALALIVLFVWAPHNRWETASWWLLFSGVLTGVAAVFNFHVHSREGWLLLSPVLAIAVAAVVASRRWARVSPAGRRDAWVSMAALLGGFLAVTLPWTAYYLTILGVQRFLHDVLFVGSSHALFFYLPLRPLGAWELGAAFVVGAMFFAGRFVGRRPGLRWPRWLAPAVVAFGALALLLVARHAPMPEGLQPAVAKRLQFLAFGYAVLVHWCAVLVLFAAALRGPMPLVGRLPAPGESRAEAEDSGVLPTIVVGVGAPLLYLSIYPRADFFHWVLSAPLTLVFAVFLYWQLVRSFLPAAGRATWAAAPLYGLVVVVGWPGWSTAARLLAAPPHFFVRLGLERAPVILEAGRMRRFAELRDVVWAVKTRTRDGDTVLGFPNLHVVNFLADRHVPGRHGSFHPGWPDHVVEAQVVNALEDARTPVVVINHNQQLFMGHAPVYYFLLRAYLRHQYRLAERVGSYDVLVRKAKNSTSGSAVAIGVGTEPAHRDSSQGREGAAAGDAERNPIGLSCAQAIEFAERQLPEDAGVLAPCWEKGSDGLQRRAVPLARLSREPAGAVPLAAAIAQGTLGQGALLPAVRAVGEIAGLTSLRFLVRAESTLAGRLRDELITGIFALASRALIEGYQWLPRSAEERAVAEDGESCSAMLRWLKSPDPRLQFAGAWLAGLCADSAAVGPLLQIEGNPDVGLQAVAAHALIRLGVREGVAAPLISTLARDEMFAPAALFDWCERNLDLAAPLLAGAFRVGSGKQRETLAFIAGALARPTTGRFVIEGIADPTPRVRMASLWAAGVLGLDEARAGILERRERDPVGQVREFAAAALRWLEGRRSAASVPVPRGSGKEARWGSGAAPWARGKRCSGSRSGRRWSVAHAGRTWG